MTYGSAFDRRGCPCCEAMCEAMPECNCASSLPWNGLHSPACYTSWPQHKVETMRRYRQADNGGFRPDSLHHFLFECQNEDLVALRKTLQLHKRCGMLAAEVVVVARNSLVWRQQRNRQSRGKEW